MKDKILKIGFAIITIILIYLIILETNIILGSFMIPIMLFSGFLSLPDSLFQKKHLEG